MQAVVCHMFIGGNISWEVMPHWGSRKEDEGLVICFPLFHHSTPRETVTTIKEALSRNGVKWLSFEKPRWIFDCELFRQEFPSLNIGLWLRGLIFVEVEQEHRLGQKRPETIAKFVILPELVNDQMPKRIFLSHKGVDKPQVRRYMSALRAVGLDPWLDEEAMVAGAELERALLAGFNQSCAAVFFVTPSYVDAGFLATEINYAIQEKRAKRDRFSIITLALKDSVGTVGTVPDLLRQYVWKTPESELEAYCEIVRALPLKIPPSEWK